MKKSILLLLLICPILLFSQNTDFSSAITVEAKNTVSGSVNSQPLFYKTELPAQGAIKVFVQATNTGASAGYLRMEVYDSRQSDLLLTQNIEKTTVSPNEVVNDTLTIPCRDIETIYFKLSTNSTFSFNFSYEMEDAESDAENNNTLETASPFRLDSTFHGTIGHLNAGNQDDADYYRIEVPTDGKFSLYMEGVNTGNSNGRLEIVFYQIIDGHYLSQEDSKIIETSSAAPGQKVTDSLILDCLYLYDGVIYIKVISNSCFTYSLKMTHENKTPDAEFTFKKSANQVMFTPRNTDAAGNTYFWRFGKDQVMEAKPMSPMDDDFYEESQSPFPFISMPVGYHKVSLTATSKDCNLSQETVQYVSIEGVENYSPKKASEGGDFNLFITGWKFDETAEVSLRKGSTILTTTDLVVNPSGSSMIALFDLHFAEKGMYDVIIKVPNIDQPFVFENGLEVTKIIYPETYSEVVGQEIWRTDRYGDLSLIVHNKGNVMASGVVAALIWPQDIEVRFRSNVFAPTRNTGTESVEVDGETFTLDRSEYMYIYDSLNVPTPIDSFNLQPYDGYVKYILIPHIPAGGYVELPFEAKSKTFTEGKVKFHTYTFKTNQQGSCDNPVYSNFNEDLTAELIDLMDMAIDQTNILPLKIFSKTAKAGQKHGGSMASYFGKKFWAWYDGYEFDQEGAMRDWLAETEANNAFALQTATDEFGSLLFSHASTKMLDKYKGQVNFINKRLANNPNMSAALTDKYLDLLNSLPHDQMRRFEALKGIFDNTKNLGTLSDKLVKLQQLVDDCPELASQLEDLIKDLEKELNIREPKEKENELRNSFDPNMISGPSGIGVNRYLNNIYPQVFTISFENLETASAAAQIVKIYDTLDVNKYDLSTFSFGSIGVGEKYFRLVPDRKEFAIERNITQDIPIKVRISGSLDESTGVITWEFVAVDTTTNDLPVLEGFLPPNNDQGEGEGFVRYLVTPKAGLADGTLFENRATIIFDQNEPISTNTWQNTLDIGKPTSTLIATLVQDTIIKLDLNGVDAVSGLGYYNLFVKINDGEWLPFGGSPLDSMLIIGEMDSTYSFYIRSIDKVGNEEDKDAFAEQVITIQSPVAILMGRLTGQNINQNTNRLQWNTYDEDNGDYFVIERSKDGSDFRKTDQVNAKGRPSSYEYFDNNPFSGNNYYRLKIVNNDGRTSYSNIVMVRAESASVISIFPNPVRGKLTVQIAGTVNNSEKLSLFNAYGQKVMEQPVTGNQIQMDMQRLTSGVYYLVYKNKDGMQEKLKIVKE